MVITRRAFLKYVTASAAALGVTSVELKSLAGVLASPSGPTVIWLQGSCCSGCSISFLDYISPSAPKDAGEVLIDVVNLAYHPTLMAGVGQKVVTQAQQLKNEGGYILVVEGGVPTAFGGNAGWAYTDHGQDVTLEEAVMEFAEHADAIVCMGTCSSFGGVAAAPPNPGQVKSIGDLTGKTTINLSGCPPHPDGLIWIVVQLMLGQTINLDAYGRPSQLFPTPIHYNCPLVFKPVATKYGQHEHCLINMNCKGPFTSAKCTTHFWNNGVSFCMGAGAPCFGCVNPDFPGTNPLFKT
jgi:hydrogenase small subunit